jgi:hypothetical protein
MGGATGFDYFHDRFSDYVYGSRGITIATGFVSTESLMYLARLVRLNPQYYVSFDLYIGMPRATGLVQVHLDAAQNLSAALKDASIGTVYVVDDWPFHGKVYLFSDGVTNHAGLIGSSNLDGIRKEHRIGELDVLSDDPELLDQIDTFLSNTLKPASITLDEYAKSAPRTGGTVAPVEVSEFLADISEDRLDILNGVRRVTEADLASVKSTLSGNIFRHKLKTTAKSNLNVYHGTGRKNLRPDKTPYFRPRPWYEVEIILSKSERADTNAPPSSRDFTVVTDDGWTFEMRRQGDFKKNLRSLGELRILGKWIKGRMETAGALTIGDVASATTLTNYGRDDITLTPIKDGRWFLDFSSDLENDES